MSILERLEQMEKRMAEIAAAGQAPGQGPETPPIQVLLNKDHGLQWGTQDQNDSRSIMTLLTHLPQSPQPVLIPLPALTLLHPPPHTHTVARGAILGTLVA